MFFFKNSAMSNNQESFYEEIDIDFNKEAYKKVSELQNRKPRIPTIVFDDGSYLVEPTDVELLEKINSYQS